jgi:hypothetical protein
MIDNCGAAYRQKYQYCAGGLLMDLGHGNSISDGAAILAVQFLDLFAPRISSAGKMVNPVQIDQL